jgi:hypothetical protein
MASKRLRPLAVPVLRLKYDVGLGDVVKKVTAAVGIPPCSGCARRAAALNRALVFRASARQRG